MNVKGIVRGSLFAFIITLLFIIVFALLSYFGNPDERVVTVGVYAGVVIGVFVGSLAVAKASENKILLHSLIVSVIYLAILVAVSALINRELHFNTHFLTLTAGIIISGLLGAVVGK